MILNKYVHLQKIFQYHLESVFINLIYNNNIKQQK